MLSVYQSRDPTMMSQARFQAMYSGMSTIARKVYDAVPIAAHWNPGQVVGELSRTGSNIEYRTVAGCLSSLIDAGLVQEPVKGYFCREPVREKLPPPKKDPMKPTAPAPAVTPAAPTSPLDRLGALSVRVAGMAQSLKELASDIGDAAIDIEAQIETSQADMHKLKQLQAILKSLN
jgi:hypothetical protein